MIRFYQFWARWNRLFKAVILVVKSSKTDWSIKIYLRFYTNFQRLYINRLFRLNDNILWTICQNHMILVPFDSSRWDESNGTKITWFWLIYHVLFIVELRCAELGISTLYIEYWTWTCSWTLNWTWTEPNFKFRFSSGS